MRPRLRTFCLLRPPLLRSTRDKLSRRGAIVFLTLAFGAMLCDGGRQAGDHTASFVNASANGSAFNATAHPTFDASRYRDEYSSTCPLLMPKVFENSVPSGRLGNNQTVIKYNKMSVKSFEDCYFGCCDDLSCNAVFMFVNNSKLSCYKASCSRDELCLPEKPEEEGEKKVLNKSFMVLVRPNDNSSNWSEISDRAARESAASRVILTQRACEVGLDQESCFVHEKCLPPPGNNRSRNGVCVCQEGFKRDAGDGCVAVETNNEKDNATDTDDEDDGTKETAPVGPAKINVQVFAREIQLPTDEATLNAYAVPKAPEGGPPYTYEWKLVSFTRGAEEQSNLQEKEGAMKNSHSPQLELSGLEQGVYQFKVTVDGKDPERHGEALANLTVLPPKHINQPPHATLRPLEQTINLPTSRAIVDASLSTDDGPKEDLKFKWELLEVPLGYEQPTPLPEGATLTLDGLTAGRYAVQVTVTDTDGAASNATATIDVEEETDYPPTANAGEDIIIYLPSSDVELHGNQSTDDHGIVSWEWTRKQVEDGKELAADSTNMRTAHPHLSNLEEGTYTFILKVTDAKGQSSTDEVNVYVKPPTNMPPTADAGKDQEVSLPQNWVILDGSGSKDDIEIEWSEWTQLSGPNKAEFEDKGKLRTNATGLTKGKYTFQLAVKDNLDNEDKSSVDVTVTQDSNMSPRARAGDDFSVTLPASVVSLNGSRSWDDLAIARWEWTREKDSAAAGKVVGGSDSEPVLMLVDVVPGQYTFQLQVWDEQGKTSTDSVTFTVLENPHRLNVVRAVFNEPLSSLTQARLDEIRQSLELLLHSKGSYRVQILQILPQENTAYAVMDFIVTTSDPTLKALSVKSEDAEEIQPSFDGEDEPVAVASGKKVVKELQVKLDADSELLGIKVLSLDTVVCQNECSGHGTCHQATRTCLCEPFWLENFVRRNLMDGKSNCEWSVIYVSILMGALACAIICGVCYFNFKNRSKGLLTRGSPPGRNGRSGASGKGQKYSRLDQSEPAIELRNAYTSSLMVSDSDSEDEISFSVTNHRNHDYSSSSPSASSNGRLRLGSAKRVNGGLVPKKLKT